MRETSALVGWKPWQVDNRLASVRIRCLEPLHWLWKNGKPVELFDARHLKNYRVVVFAKAYDATDLALAREVQSRGARVVFDLSDNHLYNPDNDIKFGQRAERLLEMLDIADEITVPCAELARHLPCEARVVRDGVNPHLHNPSRLWEKWRGVLSRGPFVELVWFGNWGGARGHGGMRDINKLRELLECWNEKVPLRLSIVSNNRPVFQEMFGSWKIPVCYQAWGSDARFRARLESGAFDVVLLPFEINPFTVCKSNNRIALALFHGVAVIADAIPSYREFAPFCVLDDWEGGLKRYLSNRQVRQDDARRGQNFVKAHYLTRHAAIEWWKLFQQLGVTEA